MLLPPVDRSDTASISRSGGDEDGTMITSSSIEQFPNKVSTTLTYRISSSIMRLHRSGRSLSFHASPVLATPLCRPSSIPPTPKVSVWTLAKEPSGLSLVLDAGPTPGIPVTVLGFVTLFPERTYLLRQSLYAKRSSNDVVNFQPDILHCEFITIIFVCGPDSEHRLFSALEQLKSLLCNLRKLI